MTLNTKCKYIHHGYTCLINSNCSMCMTDAHYAPKPKKIKFIKKKQVDYEDALVCDNGCGGKTYPSHQSDLWQHGWFAYCIDCRKNFK